METRGGAQTGRGPPHRDAARPVVVARCFGEERCGSHLRRRREVQEADTSGFRHADIYQMLAYCTAADLPSGLLVYAAAKGQDTPGTYKIKHAGKTIEVASLDLGGAPEDILGEVAASPPASGRTGTSSRHASPHRASDTAPPTPSPAWPSRQRPGAQRLPSTHCPHGPKPLPSLQHTRERRPVRNPPPTRPSRSEQRPVIPAPPLTSFPRRRESRRWRAGGGSPPQHQSKRHSPPKLPAGPPKQSIILFALSSFSIRKKTLGPSYEAKHSNQVGAAV